MNLRLLFFGWMKKKIRNITFHLKWWDLLISFCYEDRDEYKLYN